MQFPEITLCINDQCASKQINFNRYADKTRNSIATISDPETSDCVPNDAWKGTLSQKRMHSKFSLVNIFKICCYLELLRIHRILQCLSSNYYIPWKWIPLERRWMYGYVKLKEYQLAEREIVSKWHWFAFKHRHSSVQLIKTKPRDPLPIAVHKLINVP